MSSKFSQRAKWSPCTVVRLAIPGHDRLVHLDHGEDVGHADAVSAGDVLVFAVVEPHGLDLVEGGLHLALSLFGRLGVDGLLRHGREEPGRRFNAMTDFTQADIVI